MSGLEGASIVLCATTSSMAASLVLIYIELGRIRRRLPR